MIYVEYDADEGQAIGDGRARAFVAATIAQHLLNDGEDIHVQVANSIVIDAFRLAIVECQLSHDAIVFVFQGAEMKPNEGGRLVKWPPGFCDIGIQIISGLVRHPRNG